MTYSFVSLTAPQIEERRKQLDQAGFYGWLTPIVIVLGVYFYRKLLGPLVFQPDSTKKVTRTPSQVQLFSRRISWILHTIYIPEFGPLKVQLTGVIYALWLLYLVFRNTGEDYMHLTKAFGHVAISQLPVHYLLSFKTSRSPITLATGLSHEKLNAYHRLLGRIIHGFLAAHAVLYMRFFIALNLLPKRIKDRDVRLGLLAFWAFNFLGLLAIPPIRKKVYHKLFYRSHVLLSAVVVPVLFFHVPYTRKYMLQAGLFWIVGGMTRGKATAKARVRCRPIEGTDLIEVNLAVDKASSFVRATPGQHVYIQSKAFGPKNPFSVVRVSSSNNEKTEQDVTLIVRNLGGPQTAFLAQMSAEREQEISVEGPYGESSQYLPQLLSPSSSAPGNTPTQILLVAGGVGATYTLPIYLALLDARGGTSNVKFIWLVRTLDDARWGIALLEDIRGTIDVDIYITRQSRPSASSATNSGPSKKGLTIHTTTGSRPTLSSIINPVLTSPQPSNSTSSSRTQSTLLSSSSKRSDDPRRVRRVFYDKLAVLSCGPPTLARDLRKEVGRHVTMYGREVDWFEEQFGFGGS